MIKTIVLIITFLFPLITFAKNKHLLSSPYFYEITGNNINSDNPIYLLGTCHHLATNDYDDDIINKIKNTEILISEFPDYSIESTRKKHHLNRLNLIYNKFINQDFEWFRDQLIAVKASPDKIKESLELIKKEKENLKDLTFIQFWFSKLTEEENKIVETITVESGINLLSIHPALQWEFIEVISDASLDQEHVEDSLEIYLIKLFKMRDKKIVFLDTLETILWHVVSEEFIEYLQFDTDTQISLTKIRIQRWKQTPSYFKEWCWRPSDYIHSSDIDGIILENVTSAMNARNIAWKEKVMKALASNKSISIITGADHLQGESGFLNLLRSQGYHIKHAFVDESNKEETMHEENCNKMSKN